MKEVWKEDIWKNLKLINLIIYCDEKIKNIMINILFSFIMI